MNGSIARRRLHNLRLAAPDARATAVALVESFGAVQAQDYSSAKWALALRASGVTEAQVDRAFDAGRLLRTHVMRPTWQFVTPATIGWLLMLTAPRVHQACAFWNRFVGLDATLRRRSQRAIRSALRDEHYLTRQQIAAVLKGAGIAASGMRLAAILMAAEIDAVVCSGPRRERRFTYALFERRAPAPVRLSREAALEELTRRYFATHGPATLRDFAWWSGLTVTTIREGIEMVPSLRLETIEARTYWSLPDKAPLRRRAPALHLVPAFDEYIVGYRDRDAVPYKWPVGAGRGFLGSLFAGAELVGSWRRVVKGRAARLDTVMLRSLTPAETRALRAAADRYAAFSGVAFSGA